LQDLPGFFITTQLHVEQGFGGEVQVEKVDVLRGDLGQGGLDNAAGVSVVDGLTSNISKGRLVAVASPTSVDTFSAKGLLLIAFDLSYSIAE
jgi:hypothetical protein